MTVHWSVFAYVYEGINVNAGEYIFTRISPSIQATKANSIGDGVH